MAVPTSRLLFLFFILSRLPSGSASLVRIWSARAKPDRQPNLLRFPLYSETYISENLAFRHSDTLVSMDSQVVRHGTVRMKKEGFASFMFFRKWLILKEDTLSIHKTECSPAQSVITLQDVTHIERVASKSYCLLLEVKDKRYYLVLRNDEELYGWQDDIYSRSPLMGVSNPWNFVHNVHVGFDPMSGTFTGMPEQWGKLLAKSAITCVEDRKSVFDLFEFDNDQQKRAAEKMGLVPPVARPLSGLSTNLSLLPISVDGTPPPSFNTGMGVSETTACPTTTDAHHPSSLTLQITASGVQNVTVTTKECMHKVDITLLPPEPPHNRSIAIQTTSDMESESGPEAVIVPLVLYE